MSKTKRENGALALFPRKDEGELMMMHTTAYTPVTTAFASMTTKELDAFYEWFMLNKPYCLDDLIQAIWQTPGYEDWRADFSPESLGLLAEWLASQMTKVNRSSKGSTLAEGSAASAAGDTVSIISDEERSLTVLVGMYYGEVAVRNNARLTWSQLKGNKKQADYGQPVISASGTLPTNPVRVINAFACGLADGSRTSARLRETYDYWMELIKHEG